MKSARYKRTNTVWSHLYEAPRVVIFVETGSRVVADRGCWARNGELVFNGCRLAVWEDEKVLEIHGWWW